MTARRREDDEPLPTDLVRAVTGLHGAPGAAWLERLPALVARCERRWGLTVGPPFADLGVNYVAPAVRADGMPVVLKLGVPHRDLRTEIAALRAYDGRGAVRLLDADPEAVALLLERLTPGDALVALAEEDDAQATAIAAGVMARLWRPVLPAGDLPSVADWLRGFERLRRAFDGGTGPFPASLVARAEAVSAELLDSAAAPVLLHGDLHHQNILSAARVPWLAIDPKGVVGEPAYEVGALMRNPPPVADLLRRPDLPALLDCRVDVLADRLVLDRGRIIGWASVQAVLSGWWTYEDGGTARDDWGPTLALAERLAELY